MKNKGLLIKVVIIINLIIISVISFYKESYATSNDESSKQTTKPRISLSRVIKDGVYYIVCDVNANFVLDVKGASLANEAEIQINAKTQNMNQKFFIHYVKDGYYKIESISSTKVMEVKNASKDNGEVIQQNDTNDADSQLWKIRKNKDGTLNLINKNSEKALDVQNSNFESGNKVQQYDYNNSYAQRFRVEKTEILNENVNDGIISIKAKGDTDKQIDVIDGSEKDGMQLQIFNDKDSLAQRFQVKRVGENEVSIRTAASGGWLKENNSKKGAEVVQSGNSKTKIDKANTWKVEYDNGIVFINKESGLALTINGDYSNQSKIEVNDKSNTDKQKFIVRTEDLINTGYYNLQTAYGTLMDVDNAGTTDGTNIKTWSKTGGNAQVFEIKRKSDGYQIESPISGLIVEVANDSKDNKANVQLGTKKETTSQKWIPEIADGGYLTFKNVNSGLMLNVEGDNKKSGTNINQEKENKGNSQKWKIVATKLTDEYIKKDGSYYHFDNSGNSQLIAQNLGGWDFTDWKFVANMKQIAVANSSTTNWFVAVDWNAPCREVIFKWINNDWVAVAGWYCGVGRIVTSSGKPRGSGGAHTITQKWAESDTGPGYCMDYIESYKGGVPSAWGNDSASFHAGMDRGYWGYTTHSCISNTADRAKWMYDNIDLGTRMYNNGSLHGYENAGDNNLNGAVTYAITINDPFA